jgi:hypothetical protein
MVAGPMSADVPESPSVGVGSQTSPQPNNGPSQDPLSTSMSCASKSGILCHCKDRGTIYSSTLDKFNRGIANPWDATSL